MTDGPSSPSSKAHRAFARWYNQSRVLYREFLRDVTPVEPPHRGHLSEAFDAERFVGQAMQEQEYVDRVSQQFSSFLTCSHVYVQLSELGTQFIRLEAEFGSETIRPLLYETVVGIFAGSTTIQDWIARRNRALLVLMTLHAAPDELQSLAFSAFALGVLHFVFPQSTPTLVRHVFANCEGDAFSQFGAFGELFIAATKLNEAFFGVATLGEYESFVALSATFCERHGSKALAREVVIRGSTFVAGVEKELANRFEKAAEKIFPDSLRLHCLVDGASKYCKRMLDCRYGQSDCIVVPVTEWSNCARVLAVRGITGYFDLDLVTSLFPDANAIDLGNVGRFYRENTMNGSLGGAMGCLRLAKIFGRLGNNEAKCSALLATGEGIMELLTRLPVSALETPGGTLLMELCSELKAVA